MRRVFIVTVVILALLAASACDWGERLNQRQEGINSDAPLTVTKPAMTAEASVEWVNDEQAQELLRLLDQAVQENLAGDAFENLP